MYDSFYDVVLPQQEVWKSVKGFNGCYEVSNYGEIKSLQRTVPWVGRGGRHGCKYVCERILKPKYDKDGYESYVLSDHGFRKDLRGHRIVAEAFKPNVECLDVVDHIDTIKTHNFSWNLQWLTSEANTIKYYAVETSKNKSLSSLTKLEWLYIGDLYNKGITYSDIFKELGIDAESPQTLWEGLSGRRLSSVTGFKKGDFKKRPHPVQKLSGEEVMEILNKRLINKTPLKLLAEEYNIAESMISRFCSGTRRPEILEKFKIKHDYQAERVVI